MASLIKLACMIVMCMAVLGAPMAKAMTCGQVTQNVMPCLPYLMQGGTASAGCCAGVKSVLGSATTTADRQAVCNCLKSGAGAISGINTKFAEALPAQCNVDIPYKINPATNCASIKF